MVVSAIIMEKNSGEGGVALMLIYLQMIETDEDRSKFEEIYNEYRGLMYYVAYKRL